MRNETAMRRAGYLILCLAPLIVMPLAGARALRVTGVHEVVWIVLFGAIAVAIWSLARPQVGSRIDQVSVLRLAGALLLSSTALIALLWVGLATPWDATPSENQMRYAVLLAGSIGVTAGFVLLKDALADSGERIFAALALATSVLSGAAYVGWSSFQLGYVSLILANGEVSPAVASMNNVFDALLFAASALAYVATAALALALRRAGWVGQNAARVYVSLSLIAVTLLFLRGVSFPAPGSDPSPWYTRPGFIVGIPAVPWFMPYCFGVLVLRRAGTSHA
jgi:hypothetical protein